MDWSKYKAKVSKKIKESKKNLKKWLTEWYDDLKTSSAYPLEEEDEHHLMKNLENSKFSKNEQNR